MTARERFEQRAEPERQAQAECVDCRHRWWVKENEVKRGDMPECPKCRGIGVATGRARIAIRARAKEDV
jgi:ssDNA-binding Zn-finger/Zn-ribbon topoisomerase 1